MGAARLRPYLHPNKPNARTRLNTACHQGHDGVAAVPGIGLAKQVLTISTAGTEVAQALKAPTSAPVTEVSHVFDAPKHTAIDIAELAYRADFTLVKPLRS